MKITRSEFIKLINYNKEGAGTLARNTSNDREFHQAVINGVVYSGFYDKESIIKAKQYE